MAIMVWNITQSNCINCPDGSQRGQAQDRLFANNYHLVDGRQKLETILPTAVAEISCNSWNLDWISQFAERGLE
jgi:hypothetical protein